MPCVNDKDSHACFICTACGMQYAPSDKNPNLPPALCVICEEERQYVPPRGQTWTTLAALSQSHMNSMREYEPGVLGIGSEPKFGIGQRALLCEPAAAMCCGIASPRSMPRP